MLGAWYTLTRANGSCINVLALSDFHARQLAEHVFADVVRANDALDGRCVWEAAR